MIKILVLLLIIIYFIDYHSEIEPFMYFTDMVEFKRLDDSLIKKFRTSVTYNLYDNDINFLFRNDSVIRINIPFNHYVKLIYKYKENNNKTGFAKTIELDEGSHDIRKNIGRNKELDQIIINNIGGRNIYYDPHLYPIRNYYYPFYSYRTINYPRYWHKKRHYHNYY